MSVNSRRNSWELTTLIRLINVNTLYVFPKISGYVKFVFFNSLYPEEEISVEVKINKLMNK